jgi:hypothetical protein
MFLVGILSWWYGEGWLNRLRLIKERLASSVDFFSIGLLITTLFAPFRQISAGKVGGPLEYRFRAFIDRLISRFIGAMIRSFMIIIGALAILLQSLYSALELVLWPLAPLFPVIGLILMVTGWVPFNG